MFDSVDAFAHAKEVYPHESCGVFVADKYVPLKNTSKTPTTDFVLDNVSFAKLFIEKKIQAIIHSHPNGPAYPSALDMKTQLETKLPWGIIVTDKGEPTEWFWLGLDERPPLIGRPFRHGVTDCYALIRDWYWMTYGLELMEFPRNWGWWGKGDRLYEDNFEKAGFERVPAHQPIQEGDICLCTLGSKTPNHAGVYVGNNQILHHLAHPSNGYDPSRLSRHDSVLRWGTVIQYWVRYANDLPTR